MKPVTLGVDCVWELANSRSSEVTGGLRLSPGNLDESLLWTAINYEDYEMPPSGPLPENVIEDFRVWIESGAADPRETKVSAIASTITPQEIAEAQESFWAYRSPGSSSTPTR